MEDAWYSWSPAQLLWATRGLHWGFRLIVKPQIGGIDALRLYEAVFSAPSAAAYVAPEASKPEFFHAHLTDDSGVMRQIVAARFVDPNPLHADDSGRRILHELLLVCGQDNVPDTTKAPSDWHLQVFEQMRSKYDNLYPLAPSDVIPMSVEPDIARILLRVDEPAPTVWVDLGEVTWTKSSARREEGSAEHSSRRQTLRWLASLLVASSMLVVVACIVHRSGRRAESRLPEITEGRVWLDGRQYKVFVDSVTWDDARRRCEGLGGSLACPTSRQENTLLQEIGRKATGPNCRAVWIGGYRNSNDQRWQWVNGREPEFADWNGKVKIVAADAAVQLDLTVDSSSWLAARKEDRKPFVCEWPAVREPPR